MWHVAFCFTSQFAIFQLASLMLTKLRSMDQRKIANQTQQGSSIKRKLDVRCWRSLALGPLKTRTVALCLCFFAFCLSSRLLAVYCHCQLPFCSSVTVAMRAPANTAAMLELQRSRPRPHRIRVYYCFYNRPYCALPLAACKGFRRRMNTQLALMIVWK